MKKLKTKDGGGLIETRLDSDPPSTSKLRTGGITGIFADAWGKLIRLL